MADLYKYRCQVSHCKNIYRENPSRPNKHFFLLPTKDLARRKIWVNWLNSHNLDKISANDFKKKVRVCEDHFSPDSMIMSKKKCLLHRFAIPTKAGQNPFLQLERQLPPITQENASPVIVDTDSCNSSFTDHGFRLPNNELTPIPSDKTNTNAITINYDEKQSFALSNFNTIAETDSESANIHIVNSALADHGYFLISDGLPNTSEETTVNSIHMNAESEVDLARGGKLRELGMPSFKNLTPRKKKLYSVYRQQQGRICKLKNSLKKSREFSKNLRRISHDSLIAELEDNMDSAGSRFIIAQLENLKAKRPSWTVQDKVFALALYKRGPRSYRFLRKFIKLPCKSTIDTLLNKMPCKTGVNKRLFDKLRKRVRKMKKINSYCSLMFDEVSLTSNLTYTSAGDKIVGYSDLGSLGRCRETANHALVFMVQGLYAGWKQPIAYYFTRDTIPSESLKIIILDIINNLQKIGINVVCTVCDQGPTNVRALKLLKKKLNDPLFYVNDKPVAILYDVPHLLKSTRNAFNKYTIKYDGDKYAKFHYLIDAYNLDKTRRFQTLRKIREPYLYVDRYPLLKMKVKIAARTLSNTMAAAIETLMSNRSLNLDAMHTAEFVSNINDLFDSFNSNGISTKVKRTHPRLRCGLSDRSRHFGFWQKMSAFISSWTFYDEKTGVSKTRMPFKAGWLNNLKAIEHIWNSCRDAGFKYLRTRLLTQDSLENFFGTIRQCSGSNTNPSAFQFVAAYNTTILNNLISHSSVARNCEEDGSHILDNLRDFLFDSDTPVIDNQTPIQTSVDTLLSRHDIQVEVPDIDGKIGNKNDMSFASIVTNDYADSEINNFPTADHIQLSYPQSPVSHLGEIDNHTSIAHINNELLNMDPPVFDSTQLNDEPFEFQALAYVAGFLVKKIGNLNCDVCRIELLVTTPEPEHIFTNFKEYDDCTLRLKYVTKSTSIFLAHVYDVVYYYLGKLGYIEDIKRKLLEVLYQQINFSWFSCALHAEEIFSGLLDMAVNLIIRKYCDDHQRNLLVQNRKKNNQNKIAKFRHKSK